MIIRNLKLKLEVEKITEGGQSNNIMHPEGFYSKQQRDLPA